MTVIIHIISHYIGSHKRLVIPQLGTFVVKESGQVLFTEMLKRDDGVLRGLMCAAGVNELETAGEIDRFVFEVRHATQSGSEYRMAGLGLFRGGANGTIAFVQAAPSAKASMSEYAAQAADAAVSESLRTEHPITEQALPGEPHRKQGSDALHASSVEGHVSPSAKLNPESHLKGLRYKPTRNAASYTYVGHASCRGVDRFLLLAILAAVIAVAAIAFGYYRRASEDKTEPASTEQIQTPTTATE